MRLGGVVGEEVVVRGRHGRIESAVGFSYIFCMRLYIYASGLCMIGSTVSEIVYTLVSSQNETANSCYSNEYSTVHNFDLY